MAMNAGFAAYLAKKKAERAAGATSQGTSFGHVTGAPNLGAPMTTGNTGGFPAAPTRPKTSTSPKPKARIAAKTPAKKTTATPAKKKTAKRTLPPELVAHQFKKKGT